MFPIEVPALRSRRGDCGTLADAFLRTEAQRLGKKLTGLAPAALARLLAHDWPGNVRELANVIERAAIVAVGPTVTEPDLPPLTRVTGPGAVDAPERTLRSHMGQLSIRCARTRGE